MAEELSFEKYLELGNLKRGDKIRLTNGKIVVFDVLKMKNFHAVMLRPVILLLRAYWVDTLCSSLISPESLKGPWFWCANRAAGGPRVEARID